MFDNLFNNLKQWTRHNQSMVISLILACIFSFWFLGCQSETQSILMPELKVTEGELSIEYSSEIRRIENELLTLKETTELRMQDLHRQDAIKQALFNNAMLIAESGNPNPLGLLSLLGTIFGIGAVIDNRKKDGIIKGMKSAQD